jgi:hypothetical protein
MNIIVAGIIGRYPYGGVAWCSLMYLLGLRALGHRVWYLEDTGECNFDPVANTLCRTPEYALEFLRACLAPYGFGDRWCYIDWAGQYHGHAPAAWRRVCAEADLFLDLSGGCWFWRDEYAAIPHKAFIDSDPVFTQRDIARRGAGHAAFFARFDTLFTFGRNIGTPACPVPTGALRWQPTWQPVWLDAWPADPTPPRPCFTSVLSWRVRKYRDPTGNRDRALGRILRLPARTGAAFELAVSGVAPRATLAAHGWQVREAFPVSRDLDTYRAYIRDGLGEFGIPKSGYMDSNSGWFSDRTACYLASGRPAIVGDTGFRPYLPVGAGLLAYTTLDEAAAAVDAVRGGYAGHARAAREIARAYLASDVVLPALLDRATARPAPATGIEA